MDKSDKSPPAGRRGQRRPRPVSDDEAELFRQAVGPVRPLADSDRSAVTPPRPKAIPRQHLLDEAQALAELDQVSLDAAAMAAGEALSYLREGHDPRLLKRLRAGAIAVEDEIDLHHLRLEPAQQVLREFLAEARDQGHACLRIIHGKGQRSANGPVLKALVDSGLRRQGDVVAFSSAPANAGGTGATLVLLRRRRRQ
ncbi:MAG: Smr/MutS family protein [Xanthomonadales bacterium]|nr:Smr/MutS family protein [Xanthomonadales bacterium]